MSLNARRVCFSTLVLLWVVFLHFTPQKCAAAVEAVSVTIRYTDATNYTTYSVPTNKVLIVEHVFQQPTDTGSTVFYLWLDGNTNGACQLGSAATINGWHTPLRILEGWTLSIGYGGPAYVGSVTYIIFGLLVDPSDLYASIDGEIFSAELADGAFEIGTLLTSPRPAVFTVEKSTDLSSWEQNYQAVVKSGTSRDRHIITCPISGQKSFFRLAARSRK